MRYLVDANSKEEFLTKLFTFLYLRLFISCGINMNTFSEAGVSIADFTICLLLLLAKTFTIFCYAK